MANCHKIFTEFDALIALPASDKQSLRISRDDLRSKIDKYFSKKDDLPKPNFKGQGSFKMNTIIKPQDGDYDIDEGAYFTVKKEPKETVETFHNWFMTAVAGQTKSIVDKNPCIRIKYADGHHIDLSIYYEIEHEHPYLAHKKDGWKLSDPIEFMEWFTKKTDKKGQLRRIIRYLKAWGDNLKGKLPSGLVLSILATENIEFDDRDDKAFYKTLKKIKDQLEIYFACYRPTTPSYEDLLADYSKSNKNYFLSVLNSFVSAGNHAIEDPNQKDACIRWKKHFGDRFPCHLAEDKIDEAKKFSSSAFIAGDAREASK